VKKQAGRTACRAVKREFFRQKFSTGEMIKGEKVGNLSVGVEKTYVNRICISGVWISAVEKSVDNVEK